jgi:hypothetical protein
MRRRVTILGCPKGLAVPLSSPVSLLSSRAAVSFKEAEGTSMGGVMEVRASERVITQATDIVEAEEDRPLGGGVGGALTGPLGRSIRSRWVG